MVQDVKALAHQYFGIRRQSGAAEYVKTAAVSQVLAQTVTDLLNRQVDIPQVPQHVMLADARAIEAMSIVFNGDPSASLAAWDDSLKKKSPDMMAAFSADFPSLKNIPTFANPYTTTFDVENAVARKTDLIIFDIGLVAKLKDEGVMDKLNSLHIPYIFIDFRGNVGDVSDGRT